MDARDYVSPQVIAMDLGRSLTSVRGRVKGMVQTFAKETQVEDLLADGEARELVLVDRIVALVFEMHSYLGFLDRISASYGVKNAETFADEPPPTSQPPKEQAQETPRDPMSFKPAQPQQLPQGQQPKK